MNEGDEAARDAGHAFELLSQQILHGFDVVVRLGFELLDALRLVDTEAVHDRVQHVLDRRLERRKVGDGRLVGQPLQPPDLDQHAVADQCVRG